MRGKRDYLFCTYDLGLLLENHEQKMFGEIDNIDGDRLLNTSVDDWCNYFEQEYKIKVPQLDESKVKVDQEETQVDVSREPNRAIFDRSKPFYVTGTSVRFFIPFEGDKNLLECRASSYTSMPPRATIGQNELMITYTGIDQEASKLKEQFDRDLSNIRGYLKWTDNDVSKFNTSVRSKAHARLEARRQKLLKNQGLVASLGFPLRRRDNVPQTYVEPTIRRKVPVTKPSAGTKPFVPEPTLDMQEYEHILSVVTNMVTVMERSPKAFQGLAEEDLRNHFLVQLNGQYEGQATGETFNFEGKTDILIRTEGKNIFVAECKFWRGPESLKESVDQLLGYTSWRDTRTALLIFNRERAFSTVLAKIPEVVKAHPNFKRELAYQSESGFRHVLHHRDDKNRELILTVLAFEVPA